ncbi:MULTISPECIES: LysR substrate-binding domain-containing protein [Bradyrhizobium]|uniref:LysR substrate-binding domain-containing protein n=1 Tax=Bradyrhizobium TaxID=374 RepID=UPI001E45C4CA|nr:MULTISPECIES: LysR substrate-binding domain-containing protein [Bradyrhizobium]UFW54017.1 substrate-binding domain-containing protein [Bradyrhizobium arachidis]
MLVDAGQSNARGDSGHLAIGFCTSIANGKLRDAVAEFKRRFSQIGLGTTELSRLRLMTTLHSGAIDVVISPGRPLSKETSTLRLWSENIVALLPQNYCLLAKSFTGAI